MKSFVKSTLNDKEIMMIIIILIHIMYEAGTSASISDEERFNAKFSILNVCRGPVYVLHTN